MADYSYLHSRVDHTYRLGRCNQCRNRPAFAWEARTGMRLDDGMRCPKCASLLDRTSRDVLNLRKLTEDEVGQAYERVLRNLTERVERNSEQLAAWETSSRHDERGAWMVMTYQDHLDKSEKDLARVRKGYEKWLRSGTDEHEMASRSW